MQPLIISERTEKSIFRTLVSLYDRYPEDVTFSICPEVSLIAPSQEPDDAWEEFKDEITSEVIITEGEGTEAIFHVQRDGKVTKEVSPADVKTVTVRFQMYATSTGIVSHEQESLIQAAFACLDTPIKRAQHVRKAKTVIREKLEKRDHLRADLIKGLQAFSGVIVAAIINWLFFLPEFGFSAFLAIISILLASVLIYVIPCLLIFLRLLNTKGIIRRMERRIRGIESYYA